MTGTFTSETVWTILDGLREGILIIEKDGTVVFINQAAKEILLLDDPITFSSLSELFPSTLELSSLLTPPYSVTIPYLNNHYQFSSKPLLVDQPSPIQISVVQQQSQSSLDTQIVNQLSTLTRINNESSLDEKLKAVIDGLQSIGWDWVELSLRNESFHPTQTVSTEGIEGTKENRDFSNQFWLDLFHDEALQKHQHGNCYFIPTETDWLQEQLSSPNGSTPQPKNSKVNGWQNSDLFCIPLLDTQQNKIGLINLAKPLSGLRPDYSMMQAVTLYAQVAASLIENAQLIEESSTQNRELEILFNTSQALSSTVDRKQTLTILGQYMLQAVNADGYTIYQWHEQAQELELLHEFATKAIGDAPTRINTAVSLADNSEILTIFNQRTIKIVDLDQLDCLPPPRWIDTPTDYQSALLPLVKSDEIYGLIQIIKQKVDQGLDDDELRLLNAIRTQASSALEIALIFEDTYEREQFYTSLGNVNLAINFTLDQDRVIDLICSEAIHIFNVDGAYIWQITNNTLIGSAAKGKNAKDFIGTQLGRFNRDSFVSHVLQRNETQFINDASNSPFVISLPKADQIQALLGIPLTKDGEAIGVLMLADLKNRFRFTHRDISWGSLYGVQVSIGLQNANLINELRYFNEELDSRVAGRTQELNQQNERVNILLRITSELSRSLDQDRVMTQALALVNEVANAKQGIILLIDQPSGELYFRASLGEANMPTSNKGIPSGLKKTEGLAGWIIDNRSAVIVHDTEEDPRWIDLPKSRHHKSVLGLPLISNDEVFGVLMLFHSEKSAFTAKQLDLVEAATIQVANAINNAQLYQLIFDQAERLGSALRNEIIQKANLEAVLESMADGVLVSNERNIIEMVNHSACTILTMPRDQLKDRPINQLLGLFSHFEESWLAAIEDWGKNSDRIEAGIFLSDQLQIEDKFINVKLSPVISDKQFYGTVSIFRDVTKEVEVEQLKNEFVSTVSHELRTPMTSIKGYVDLMLMGAAGTFSDAQNQFLNVIKSNAERLHMLVNDLLDISRIETGKTTLDLRPLDIPQLIDQIVNNHLIGRIHDEGKTLQVDKRFDPSLPLVSADQRRVSQILTNLLDNAFNYTNENGKVIISATTSGQFVYVSVEDNGIGISDDNLSKIFDRFYRSENPDVQKVSGTGLGLAIVQSLVEMHGGRLIVQSEFGIGSKFTFNLPVVVEDGDPTYD
ncbi:MAG: GAF domain-containing protein [Chloroflexota bacterium]